LKKNSLIGITNPLLKTISIENKRNVNKKVKEFQEYIFPEKNKYILTQREVTSGSLKIRPEIYSLNDSIEVELTDKTTKKKYQLYYYSDSSLILGFNKIFENYIAIQGLMLTLEQTDEDKFKFAIRTSKKGTIANKIVFDDEKNVFRSTEEKIATSVFISRLLYLESWIMEKVAGMIDDLREIKTFKDLLHKIFFEFGQKEKNFELHILTLYHIADLVYPVNFKTILEVVLDSHEFVYSEKSPGIFYLDSEILTDIEEEEKKRRQVKIEEARKKREEQRQHLLEEEMQLKEERRKIREERRNKREAEMRQKELDQLRQKQEKAEAKKPVRKKAAATADTPRADKQGELIPGEQPTEKDLVKLKKAKQKKHKPEIEEKTKDKPIVAQKKKVVEDDGIDMEEVKDQIHLEKLKEDLAKTKVKKAKAKKEKAKKIAYKDEGAFGGIFADKLDTVIKKDDKKTKKKKK
jgi:hypothetical protein